MGRGYESGNGDRGTTPPGRQAGGLGAMVRVLDAVTADKIAAGEVVESPASVVKELVENSLDAGATRIIIEVEGGGKRLVSVADNGVGMTRQDLILSVKRHATSKISDISDLAVVSSLGFRGEALPSIAAVSRMRVSTRQRGSLEGHQIMVSGGHQKEVRTIGCSPGTTVIVADLFFNVPARLKHLPADPALTRDINRVSGLLAMGHPQVSFQLLSGGKAVFHTPGNGSLVDAIASIWGHEFARQLIPLGEVPGAQARSEVEDYGVGPGVGVDGLISRPADNWATRGRQAFYVNGRIVSSSLIERALDDAFGSQIPEGRFPGAVLKLSVSRDEVDVNVHPTKKEIRFNRGEVVAAAVTEVCRLALGGVSAVGRHSIAAERGGTDQSSTDQVSISEDCSLDQGKQPGQTTFASSDLPADQAAGRGPSSLADRLADLEPIGQLHATYLLCQDPTGLYIIDQHAAHERILFERALEDTGGGSGRQPLLVPVTLNLAPGELAVIDAVGDDLAEMGFIFEGFGGNTVIVNEVPAWLGTGDVKTIVSEVFEALQASATGSALGDSGGGLEGRRRDEVLMAACKSAVKSNRYLAETEARQLLLDLSKCREPLSCPHGRPTVVQVPLAELRRRFGR